MSMSVRVHTDLLELLVTHLEQNIDCHLLPFEDLPQMLQSEIGEESVDAGRRRRSRRLFRLIVVRASIANLRATR